MGVRKLARYDDPMAEDAELPDMSALPPELRAQGALDIALEVFIQTAAMREKGLAEHRLVRGSLLGRGRSRRSSPRSSRRR